MSALLLTAALGSLVCVAAAVFLLRALKTQEKFTNRISFVRRSAGLDDITVAASTIGPIRLVSTLGSAVAASGLLSASTIAELRETLAVAGLRRENGFEIFIGSKILLFICLPLATWFGLSGLELSSFVHNLGTLSAAIVGLVGPDFVAKKIRARYLKALGRGLPDALDMMVICSEAGLGLEPSISRVAGEIKHVHPVVATELQQTASELRILSDRRVALQNMGSRTGLEALKRLGATLIQTTKYGTPLSQALRTLSTEIRAEMLTQFEERAAKLPVLLTVPMIVFILPTVFVVVGGPAMLQVMSRFHN